MSDDRIRMVMKCPNEECGKYPGIYYTATEWRQFVEDGILPFYCIHCDGNFQHVLTDEEKAGLLEKLVLQTNSS